MQQKQTIWRLKRKSLNINLLFIELLYKIKITFVIMRRILRSFLMHLNKLNHAVKECARALFNPFITTQANVHYVGASWGFAKYSILSNYTSLKQQLRYYYR